MVSQPWLAPLLDADAMRAADAWAIEERGIPSLELMETAGSAVADAVAALGPDGPVRIVCGKGNNGGDGIVVARLLRERGFEAELILLWGRDELSADATANLARFEGTVHEGDQGTGGIEPLLEGSAAVVDAIFGTGFSGAPRAPADRAIEAINDCGAPVVACDIASGVDASDGVTEGAVVDATLTVTFHAAKVGHFVAPGKWRTGELRVAPIGIPADAPAKAAAATIELDLLDCLPRRAEGSTKFTSGQVLVVGGSRGLSGSVCLTAEAAIRAGAGYATVAAPAGIEPILEMKLTEVMTVGLPESDDGLAPAAADTALERAESAGCVVLGPGLGRSEGATSLARRLAREIAVPLLIDADGLNAHAGELDSLAGPERPLILTPHAGELGRLLGRESGQIAARRLASAREAARAAAAIVVLKGDDTIVTDGERVAVNRIASPALATAGTGDMLSGTIAALVARGMDPFEAACAGVLAGARAGREAAARIGGADSVIASDVIAALPAGLAR